MINVRFSHLDYNVVDLIKAIRFYDPLMEFLGFTKESCNKDWCIYSNQLFKICLVRTESPYLHKTFHRKQPGLNHLAFQVDKRHEVDELYKYLVINKIPILYGGPGNFHHEIEYYAVFFEDPFRLKLEVVYSPNYLEYGTV